MEEGVSEANSSETPATLADSHTAAERPSLGRRRRAPADEAEMQARAFMDSVNDDEECELDADLRSPPKIEISEREHSFSAALGKLFGFRKPPATKELPPEQGSQPASPLSGGDDETLPRGRPMEVAMAEAMGWRFDPLKSEWQQRDAQTRWLTAAGVRSTAADESTRATATSDERSSEGGVQVAFTDEEGAAPADDAIAEENEMAVSDAVSAASEGVAVYPACRSGRRRDCRSCWCANGRADMAS